MKIVMACGGSGGHIFPAISVAEEIRLRHPDCRVLFVCGKKEIEEKIFRGISKEQVFEIESAAFLGGRALARPAFLLKLAHGFLNARAFLKRERPDLVAGFGGYFSFPVLAAAKTLGIPCVVHEQNVVPGLANKALAPWVAGTALSYPETKQFLPRCRQFQVTGNPIRASIESGSRREALDHFQFSPEKITMLVLGGSQGADSINRIFLDALRYLPETLKRDLQVLHLCGRMDPEDSEKTCQDLGVSCRATSFFDRMDMAYNVSDLALGRAGATFLAEIEFKKVPAILVPYPYAGAHQMENAKIFQRGNQAVILEQSSLSAEKLASVIEETYGRVRMDEFRRPVPAQDAPVLNARVRLADFMLSFVL